MTFNAINISGNILSTEFITNALMPGGDFDGYAPATFQLDLRTQGDFEAHLTRTWQRLTARYEGIRDGFARMDAPTTRDKWVLPLLRDLGFDPQYQRAKLRVGKLEFSISHRGGKDSGNAPLQILGTISSLDARDVTRRGSKSPQTDFQAFLNQNHEHDWGVLTNGVALRVLRDYYHTATAGYVQFNLLQMLETRDFPAFRALFRFVHATRFAPRDKSDCWLEAYYLASRNEGTRAEAALRDSVRHAVETLGNAVLTAPLAARLQDRHELERFHQEILRVIYRVIFLFYAEQRQLVPRANAPYAEVYRGAYSISGLRELAEQPRPLADTNTDLWERLVQTFRVMEEGHDTLGVVGFNSSLFHPDLTQLVVGPLDPAQRGAGADVPRVTNAALLEFIDHLAFSRSKKGRERINYRDLAVEEIGHVYEGLLDFAPAIANTDITLPDEKRTVRSGAFFLDARGMTRKGSGSYYTPRDLVQEVIQRSLIPTVTDRLMLAGDDVLAQEQAILDFKVCDPACGSGAFLIGATNALAAELVTIRLEQLARTGGPTDTDTPQHLLDEAKREVLSHCIYGVDMNPLSVELCRVALWINAAAADKPLSFLEHHIKHGNSLIGAPANFLQLSIHPDAYKGRGDAHPAILAALRSAAPVKQITKWRTNYSQSLFQLEVNFPNLDAMPDDTLGDVRKKADMYHHAWSEEKVQKLRLLADYWTSAFFYPVGPEDLQRAPRHEGLITLAHVIDQNSFEELEKSGPLGNRILEQVSTLKARYHFFHWWLEFPDVFFDIKGQLMDTGGFDAVLGNPPWERVKLQDTEFFSQYPEIRDAPNADQRKQLIATLRTSNPTLHDAYTVAVRDSDAVANFFRISGRYPLGGVGDVNTYTIFTEHSRDITAPHGRTGIIVPSAIATDSTTEALFADFVESKSLVALHDFENREGIFKGVHKSYRFCTLFLTAQNTGPDVADLSFFNTRIQHLLDDERHFTLTAEEFGLVNPNGWNCPTFRSKQDAELTKKLYYKAGAFIRAKGAIGSTWKVALGRMLHMSDDSEFFRDRLQREEAGATLKGNSMPGPDGDYLPLYEGKMIHHFSHRFATYEGATARDSSRLELISPDFVPIPDFWVPAGKVHGWFMYEKEKLSSREQIISEHVKQRDWLLAFRDICRSTDERTAIFSVVPFVGVGHTAPLVFFDVHEKTAAHVAAFLGNSASLTFDFAARQKVGGAHLTYTILEQLPVLPPDVYSPEILGEIVPRVLELVYTAWDIKPFADDVWKDLDSGLRKLIETRWRENRGHAWNPPAWSDVNPQHGIPFAPFRWDETRRAQVMAELDAIYAYLYGLTEEELLWVLDPRDVDSKTPSLTFPRLRLNEEQDPEIGEYRTKRLVLEAFRRLPLIVPTPPDVSPLSVSQP